MAGRGSRFVDGGYKKPKPFIDVLGKTMIENVLSNLKVDNARFILIVRKEHIENFPDTVAKIKNKYNVVFIPIDMGYRRRGLHSALSQENISILIIH